MQVGAAVARDISVASERSIENTVRPAVNAPSLPLSVPVGTDSVGGLLEQMAMPQVAGLIAAIESRQGALDAPALPALMQAAVSAVAAHDVPRALAAITALIVQHPDQLEGIRSEPAFASIRVDLENLLQGREASARTDTEVKLSIATLLAGTERDDVLSVAHQLFTTDRHVNVLLAGTLAESVINTYTPVHVPVDDKSPLGRKRRSVIQAEGGASPAFAALYEEAMKSLSEHVPLLLTWLALGLLSGLLTLILRSFEVGLFSAALPLEVWGAGTAGFLGFGSYRRGLTSRLTNAPQIGK